MYPCRWMYTDHAPRITTQILQDEFLQVSSATSHSDLRPCADPRVCPSRAIRTDPRPQRSAQLQFRVELTQMAFLQNLKSALYYSSVSKESVQVHHRQNLTCSCICLLVNGAGFANVIVPRPEAAVTGRVGSCCTYAASSTGVQCEVNCY